MRSLMAVGIAAVLCAGALSRAAAAAATANPWAAARVTTQTETTNHSFLGVHWKTTKTTPAIKGDIKSFSARSAKDAAPALATQLLTQQVHASGCILPAVESP